MRRFPSSSSSSSDETENASGLDSSNVVSRMRRRREIKRQITSRERQRESNHSKDIPRSAELNPSLSFKHFLQQNDNPQNYHHSGARPKVYPTHRANSEINSANETIYPRNPTKLPDFVQDHLVIEQCYMNPEDASAAVPDMDNLPDFALNSVEKRSTKKNDVEGSRDLSFDLTDYLNKRHREQPSPNISDPEIEIRNMHEQVNSVEALRFPFDLQVPAAESNFAPNESNSEDCPANNIPPNVTKSLPDFLNDGPIRNRGDLPSDRAGSSSNDLTDMRQLRTENENLRRELEIAQRLATDRLSRIQTLEAELSSRRLNNHEEILEKTIEQVEDNLKRSTKRAISAESTIATLQKKIDSLTNEISMLRLENTELRLAIGLDDNDCKRVINDKKIACIATDLKTAATSAETSLRQLMSGVSNLRVLASTLENLNRIEDRTKEYLQDFEEENAAGPVL